ncbi:MAG: hypothetical protein GXD23_15260 [Comamonadaceae bacterium]|jgi:hypothetical protein|uniref:hypothetical protein n=1 Tax=Hydrogenophaga sp. PML113 TaxID=1899350 RepID=UPI000878B590|nr:hypothetical protein [Hydrogenophaga sp. PML113]NCT98724.1 hypothetical protein [Comamonadaceae bacterium]
MHLTTTEPLTVINLVSRKAYSLLPVRLACSAPSKHPDIWRKFMKLGGRVLPISKDDTERVRIYLRHHGTEAVTADGAIAFTLNGDFLAECVPEACGQQEDVAVDLT